MQRRVALMLLVAAATGVLVAGAASAKGSRSHHQSRICSGTLTSPGTLTGTYRHGAIIKGTCNVNAGDATVKGTLQLRRGATLIAAYGSGTLTVNGHVVVGRGATLVLGCGGPDSPCLDETNPSKPTLSSVGVIHGSLTASKALAVIVHNSKITGNVKQVGGGGGLDCTPPTTGPFSLLKSPVFSAYEDNTIGKNLEVKNVTSCWLGITRDTVKHSVKLIKDKMGDPDAIEVLSNTIHRNLACFGNGHPSGMPTGTQPVWDSSDISPTGALYPRMAEPNTVSGKRLGQCVLASPSTQGGSLGPGLF